MVDLASQLIAEIMETAIPVAVLFELSNILVSTVLRAAFGGKLWFGR